MVHWQLPTGCSRTLCLQLQEPCNGRLVGVTPHDIHRASRGQSLPHFCAFHCTLYNTPNGNLFFQPRLFFAAGRFPKTSRVPTYLDIFPTTQLSVSSRFMCPTQTTSGHKPTGGRRTAPARNSRILYLLVRRHVNGNPDRKRPRRGNDGDGTSERHDTALRNVIIIIHPVATPTRLGFSLSGADQIVIQPVAKRPTSPSLCLLFFVR